MKRSMLQTYVKDADGAIALYQKAFDAKLLDIARTDEGVVIHSELEVYGQVLAVAETEAQALDTGNTMQFCLHFAPGEEDKVKKASEALCEGGKVLYPLGKCMYADLMVDVIDPYGVRWCIFAC